MHRLPLFSTLVPGGCSRVCDEESRDQKEKIHQVWAVPGAPFRIFAPLLLREFNSEVPIYLATSGTPTVAPAPMDGRTIQS